MTKKSVGERRTASGLSITPSLKRKLKIAAAIADVSMSELVEAALEMYLREHHPQLMRKK